MPKAADTADDEQQIGQEFFDELKAAEIVAALPLYDLGPLRGSHL